MEQLKRAGTNACRQAGNTGQSRSVLQQAAAHESRIVSACKYVSVDVGTELWVLVCVCLLLQDLLQSCSRGGEEESGRQVL